MKEQAVFPVLSLYQPWAAYIMMGYKLIETRLHDRFKGIVGKQILIHAARNVDNSVEAQHNQYLTPEEIKVAHTIMFKGAIIGSAIVDKARWLEERDSQLAMIDCKNTKRFGLHLTHITMFDEPLFERGSMGIWYYDMANREKVRKPKTITA